MLSIVVGVTLAGAGLVLLLAVCRPEAWRAYFYRSRHCRRAVQRRRRREADPVWRTEQWFREWKKQYPALMDETREMRVLRDT